MFSNRMAAYIAALNTGRSQWWHWIVGAILITGLYIGGAFLLFYVAYSVGLPVDSRDSLWSYSLLMLSFLPLFFGVLIVQKVWHQRSITSLMTGTRRFRWGNMARAGAATLLVIGLFLVITALFFPSDFDELTLNPNMSLVWMAALVTFLLVPFQAASEEFLMRGYLNQALIRYLKSPWAVFVLTSLGFALLHIWNSEAEGQEWFYLTVIFSFGMAACILLYFEGGIESAIGFHIVNNIYVFSVIGYETDDMPVTALYNSRSPEIDLSSVIWELVSLTLVVCLTLWLNRKFGTYDPVKTETPFD